MSINEESLNLQVRRFLKKVGINAQREIEQAVRDGIASGSARPGERIEATMNLSIPSLGVSTVIADTIKLDP